MSTRRSAAFAALAVIMCLPGSWARAAVEPEFAHPVVAGDTLIGISERLLARPTDWPILVKLNKVPNPRRLKPGSTLRIPVALLREQPANATIVAVSGEVTGPNGTKLAPGMEIGAGASLQTAADGAVTLRVPDGSLISLQPKSAARITTVSRYAGTEIFSSVFRVLSGRIEALVNKLTGPSRFEVQTEFAVAGVRGTRFRVASEAAPGAAPRAQTEVLEGAVGFAAAQTPGDPVLIAAGFGSVTDATGRPQPATALLTAPQIDARDNLQERLISRFRFPAVDGARSYRAQVAADAEFRQGVNEATFSSNELKFADLADGDYFLRARAIDALGLEGRDAIFTFRLKARPEPPLLSVPAPNGKVRATTVRLEWGANLQAATYRLQISEDEAFARVVQDEIVNGTEFTSRTLPFGDYWWRVRSLKGDGASVDAGPWGDTRKFSLRPPPKTPEPPEESAGKLVFSWSGEPGQKFRFQMAGDPLFARTIEDRDVNEPGATTARPQQGTYYVRVRATDADGFVGPFSAAQRFVVINRLIDSGGANLTTSDGQPVRLQ